jgi:hypothetical protein
VLAISFLLIYLIMVALYDSFVYPFVALFSIPVAAIGAFLALNLSMSNLSLFALLGLIMLMGLVTKNAILIVDFTNQLKAEGLHYREALIHSGQRADAPHFDDDAFHGHRYVANCLGERHGQRVEKRLGVGHHRRPIIVADPDGVFGADDVLLGGSDEGAVGAAIVASPPECASTEGGATE